MSPLSSRTLPFALASLTLALAACGGSSSSSDPATPEPLTAQAVDGYIVGGSVTCDGVAGGGTAAAGRLNCPAGTELVRVRGGTDVGFDATATTGDVAFTGELAAPATLSWVTPLSTVAVAMASDANGFDPARMPAAVEALSIALGQSGLDLDADAASTMQIVRLNAQLHQLIDAFADSPDEYVATTEAFAELVGERAASGLAFNLGDDARDTMVAVNERLERDGSSIALDAESLEERIAAVTATNQEIDGAQAPGPVAGAAEEAPRRASITIDREEPVVYFEDRYYFQQLSLEEFESDRRYDGVYATTVSTDVNFIQLSGRAFEMHEDLDRVPVSMGFELVATRDDDRRTMSATVEGIRLSAEEGDSGRLVTEVPDDSAVSISMTDRDGTVTRTTVRIENGKLFDAIGGELYLRWRQLRRALEKRGLEDIVEGGGNYRLTFAIGGLAFDTVNDGVRERAGRHTIDAGDSVVTGSGLRGYVSIVGDETDFDFDYFD